MRICRLILVVFVFNIFCCVECEAKKSGMESQANIMIDSVTDFSRVVSLAPSVTEIIFSIRAHDKLVGVSRFSDYPEEAKLLPKVGSYIKPDLERIFALKPDICIAVEDGNPIDVLNRLKKIGIPVYLIKSDNLSSLLTSITEIGYLLDAEDKASILVESLKNRIDNINKIVLKSNFVPRVFFQLGIFPIVSVGKKTVTNDLINLANGINVTEELDSYPSLSFENALKFFPEIVIITSMCKDASLAREKKRWEKWLRLLSVTDARVFVENADLFNRPSPRLVDGLESLARKMHPELFEEFL